MSAKSETNPLVTILYLIFNIICSILIVVVNKWIYVHIGFPNLTLTMLHFLTTSLGLCLCEKLNVFKTKSVQIKEMLNLALTFCGFVVFTNLSLQHNTVGTYQLAKVMTTPVIIILQILFYQKTFTLSVKLTLVPITLGVVLYFYYDIKFNTLGTVYAIVGVLVTSVYQILVSAKQYEMQMDPMQLLYYQAPISTVMLSVLVVILEPPLETIYQNWDVSIFVMVVLSCVTAFFVNLSIYWIIGKTSPLTYNMVGHLKFCLTVMLGCLIFNEPITLMQVIGVIITVVGVTSYAHVKMKEQTGNKSLEEG